MTSTDMPTPARRRPIGRIVALVSAGILLAAAGGLFVGGHRSWRGIDAVAGKPPLRMSVDLSKPGRATGTLHHVYRDSHAVVCRIVPTDPESAAVGSLDRCEGTVVFTNADGQAVVTESFKYLLGRPDTEPDSGDPPWLFRFNPRIPLGDYAVTVDVTQPATKAAGRRYELVADYWLCGLEYASAQLAVLGGFVCLVVALIVLLIVAIRALRARRRVRRGQGVAAND